MRETEVAVIGGGVVGCAVLHALARRGIAATLLEAEPALALGASGTNSGILHTGFDSAPGELETRLILRSAALRDEVLEDLGVPVLRCGAVLRPGSAQDEATVRGLAENAARNGVAVTVRADGALEVPGEAVTDPVAYTLALAGAAAGAGAGVDTGARVEAIARDGAALVVYAGEGSVRCAVAINCAGLFADDVARLAGDDDFAIRPRKGEFFVFDAPPGGRPLEQILLPVPTKRTKGVLVFPTLDGHVVAGPTAHDQDDKGDWTVRDDAAGEVLPKARAMLPALEGAEPVFRYAGLRPAGRDGVNYAIGPSPRCPGLVHVAAIRSTGLSASLGIAEHVLGIVSGLGVALGADRVLGPGRSAPAEGPWWQRAARHRGVT
jgi:glycerol-3-phosphate dehydrogenase